MHRESYRPGLVKNGPCYCLTDPPTCIRAELVSLGVIKTEYSAHEAKVAFLDKVGQSKSLVHISFRNADHQSQVGPDHFIFCGLDRTNVGLDLGMQLKKFSDVRIFYRASGNRILHVVELLLLRFQRGITFLPEVNTILQYLHLRNA